MRESSMHGLIFSELKKYVETKFDAKTWDTLQEKAGLKGNLYLAASVYPDNDLLSLVTTACQMTGVDAQTILEDFGDFIAPDLIRQYSFLIKPEWTLVDFLCNTEDTIHKIVRFHPGVAPPQLMVRRLADDRVTISYDSKRKMCALLKGIVKGAAKHFNKSVSIVESRCMLQGDPECTVHVQVEASVTHSATPQKAAAR
jgi:predicted hydrocarbon binding protein